MNAALATPIRRASDRRGNLQSLFILNFGICMSTNFSFAKGGVLTTQKSGGRWLGKVT